MHDYTRNTIRAEGAVLRHAAELEGVPLGTAEAEAWVRDRWPQGEFWAFVVGPDMQQHLPARGLEAGRAVPDGAEAAV